MSLWNFGVGDMVRAFTTTTTKVVIVGGEALVHTANAISEVAKAAEDSGKWLHLQAAAMLKAEVKAKAAEYGWACETAEELLICQEALLAMGDEQVTAAARVVQAQPVAMVQLPPTVAPTGPSNWANGVPDQPPA
jgi:hypothetical protein